MMKREANISPAFTYTIMTEHPFRNEESRGTAPFNWQDVIQDPIRHEDDEPIPGHVHDEACSGPIRRHCLPGRTELRVQDHGLNHGMNREQANMKDDFMVF